MEVRFFTVGSKERFASLIINRLFELYNPDLPLTEENLARMLYLSIDDKEIKKYITSVMGPVAVADVSAKDYAKELFQEYPEISNASSKEEIDRVFQHITI